MKLIADTNVLLRAIVRDDPEQAVVADAALRSAEQIILTLQAICELSWVLKSRYRRQRRDIAVVIRRLMQTPNVLADRTAVAAGLAMLDAGGDFADGIINYDGRRLGGDVLATFDMEAGTLVQAFGDKVVILSTAK